jgi:hypothetical protein
VNREELWTALFALFSGLADFAVADRRLQHWDDAPGYPALYLNQGAETVSRAGRGLPSSYTMSAEIYLYVRNESNGTPATQLNELLDKVTPLFNPDPIHQRQTLGGLVHDAWIDGSIARDEGTLGDIGVAIVPIKILLTDKAN